MLFQSCGQILALPANMVRRVDPIEDLTRIPVPAGVILGILPSSGYPIPLVDLASMLNLKENNYSLALTIQTSEDSLALPIDEVLGFTSESSAPKSTSLLSEEFSPNINTGPRYKARVINPALLATELRQRLSGV